MGIRGLRSFIYRHARKHVFMHKLESYLLGECVLIIEAPNLLYNLHEHLGLDATCGGQYEEYYRAVVEFFSTLKREYPCLRVILLLVEVTEVKKLEVIMKRKLDKVQEWAMGLERAESLSMIPNSANEVFYEAVKHCGVETLFYDREADDFLSALAMFYIQEGKPAFILSEDTDFYFTQGLTGAFCLQDIVWSPSSKSKPILRESRFFSLPAFLRELSCQVWMIPFIAVIQGNDATPMSLKTALEPVKTLFSTQGRGHFFNKLLFYLTNNTGNEMVTIAKIKSHLRVEMHVLFDATYAFNKNRYLAPIRNIEPGDVPSPQLLSIKAYYPGVARESLLRIAVFWSNRMRLFNNSFSNSEDYNQPPAALASRALRAYWHAVILLPTNKQLMPPNQITEIIRRKSGAANVIIEDKFSVLFQCGYCPLPDLLLVQEMPRGDKINIFRSIMHVASCEVIFSETEFVNYDVSVILSTLYYWFHQISFRETKSPSCCTPLSSASRDSLLRTLLTSSLAVYYKHLMTLPAIKAPDLRKVTRHEHFHSIAEWCHIQRDTNNVLTVLDLPTVSARLSYNGNFLLSMVTNNGYCNAVETAVKSVMRGEFYGMHESLFSPCLDMK